MAETSLLHLLGQHPILVAIASQLSTLDLFHLGLASRYYHALILGSPEVFSVLKRRCLCDGRGLQRRRDYFLERPRGYLTRWDGERVICYDEEIEMRLFARRCDAAGALPCLRCGVNICEECRDYPRTLPSHYPVQRPHLSVSAQVDNVMCLCPKCDEAMEERVRGQFLSELCDCDTYRRWICTKCRRAEGREVREYEKKHTLKEGHRSTDQGAWEAASGTTKMILDHGFEMCFFCTCGSTVPDDMAPRCIWCKRRHPHDDEWYAESPLAHAIPPYVDDGGCYPRYDEFAYRTGYPALGYQGSIYRNPDNLTERDSKDQG